MKTIEERMKKLKKQRRFKQALKIAMADSRVNVLRVTQGPMNPLRWCLDLSCGHEVWVTAKSRPKRRRVRCEQCSHNKQMEGTDDA